DATSVPSGPTARLGNSAYVSNGCVCVTNAKRSESEAIRAVGEGMGTGVIGSPGCGGVGATMGGLEVQAPAANAVKTAIGRTARARRVIGYFACAPLARV